MPTFIKTGFWEKTRKGYKEWLNLDQFVESKIPTSTYKVYTALLSQTGVQIPISSIQEDTIGSSMTFIRGITGQYQIVFNDVPFSRINDVYYSINSGNGSSTTISIQTGAYGIANSLSFYITTKLNGVNTDGILQLTPFEIRVYN